MTERAAEEGIRVDGAVGASTLIPSARRVRPEVAVAALATVIFAVTAPLMMTVPDLGSSTMPSWTGFVVIAAFAFAFAELAVFHFEFRTEAISFSLSEVPIAFSVVFLAPGPALGARLVGSAIALIIARRPPLYKLWFNLTVFSIEIAVAFHLFRAMLGVWGDGSTAIVVAAIIAIGVTTTFGSILVSIAIAMFEGDVIARITDELRSATWLYMVNATLGGMALTLALVSPLLAGLAVIPMIALWYVIQTYGEIGQRLRDLNAIHGFAGRIGQSLNLEEIAESAVSEAARLFRSEAAALVVFDVGGLPFTQTFGAYGRTLPTSADDPGWGALIEADGPQIVARRHAVDVGIRPVHVAPGALVAPVRDETGPLGVLVIAERLGAALRYDEGDVARMQNITEQLASALRKGLLHRRIEHEARHDSLTGLPNRSAFERHVAAVAQDRPEGGLLFVVMLDLDRFKEVNDTLGHHAGDELLVEFSRRISSQLAPGDVLARLAGDEFALLAHRADTTEMLDLARSCVDQAGQPVTLDGLEIVVTASVGMAVLGPDDRNSGAPMRRADIAMYNAKSQRSGIEVYRNEIDRRTPARLSMLGDLRTAIERDELDVHYQPKLDLATGTVIGAEALVRWTHAIRGVVQPIDFVRVAEDTGLIKRLTDLLLARGIGALRHFHDLGHPLGLSVNLSTHDLLDTKLPERVESYLNANGVDPGKLTMEITESSLLIDAPRSRSTIDGLHDIGVRMSIDDFGTGYSSLSYLRRLPVSELKIDQSFIANLLIDEQDEVIVRSTIDLGHNLGLEVVAEGVESNEVLDRLREFGCDVAQGFCISRPLEARHFMTWLNTTMHPSRRQDPSDPEAWNDLPAGPPSSTANAETVVPPQGLEP